MPVIGLLSDSHGHAGRTRLAVETLRALGPTVLLHLGDVGSVEVIDALAVDWAESRLVFGNTDWEAGALGRYAESVGVGVAGPSGTLELGGGRRLVFTHGHLVGEVERALAGGVAYLCHGHTHRVTDRRVGRTRVVNPGALTRAARHTVAVLDTDADRVAFQTLTES